MKGFALFFIGSIISTIAFAQLSDSIVGMIKNQNTLTYCKIDIGTGNVTAYQSVPGWGSNKESHCIDIISKKYYYSDGKSITEIDASSGAIMSNYTLSIPSTVYFTNMRFNPCDETIYGFLSSTTTYQFAKYKPSTNTFTIISSIPSSVLGPWGAFGFIDSDSSLFYSHTGHGIAAIDLNTGQVKIQSMYITQYGENFNHIALNCKTGEIFGLITNFNGSSSGTACIGKVDPYTGIVTHVSPTWTIGVWSPVAGGQCINQYNGQYYYAAHCGATIVEANTSTLGFSKSFLTANDFNFIDHFSACDCKQAVTSGIEEANATGNIYYNYISGDLIVNSENSGLTVYDVSGKVIIEENVNGLQTIGTENLSNGIYFYRLRSGSQVVKTGKFIK